MKPMQKTEVEVENSILNEISGEGKGKVYELGYLLVPSIKEEDVVGVYGNLKELVSSFGGEVISDEMPKMTNLAYSMLKVVSNVRSKFNTAYFGWIKFTMDSQKVIELKKTLDLDPNVVRFLILKTVKENTIAAKRYVGRDSYKKPSAKKTDGEHALPINEEQIDKEIDALVVA